MQKRGKLSRLMLPFRTGLFIILITSNGCSNNCSLETNKKLLGTFFERKLEFPAEMELLGKERLSDTSGISTQISKADFSIVHFFTADCDKCIVELTRIQQYLKGKEDKHVRYLFIASAPTKIYVEEATEKINFQYPVFFEKKYFSYNRLNKFPAGDKAYNTLLLNRQGKIISLGTFYDNENAEKLYSTTIECY